MVETASRRVDDIRTAHGGAREKLDSAEYALSRLLDDLSGILRMPDPGMEAVGAVVVLPSGRSFEELRRLDRQSADEGLRREAGKIRTPRPAPAAA